MEWAYHEGKPDALPIKAGRSHWFAFTVYRRDILNYWFGFTLTTLPWSTLHRSVLLHICCLGWYKVG